jgi:MraZ protein
MPDAPGANGWGEFERCCDDKGRVAIPPELRPVLGGEIVATRGPDGAVALFSMATWARMEAQLGDAGLPPTDASYLQRMLAGRIVGALDRQNRLSVPAFLRHWAGIEPGSVVVLIGMGGKVEIWAKDAWHRYAAGLTRERVAQAVRAAGISDLWGS